MPQYPHRKSALRALKKFTPARSERLEGEKMSWAETLLIDSLIYIEEAREESLLRGRRVLKSEDEVSKKLKSIARSLGLLPIEDWSRSYLAVRKRMGQRFGVPVELSYRQGTRKVREYKIEDTVSRKETTFTYSRVD